LQSKVVAIVSCRVSKDHDISTDKLLWRQPATYSSWVNPRP
jgi:hypothetical protein